ncbi:SPOR domain-containing protein [bacterium]|nr:SPOR domain-containing protein [bacterium]
MAEDDLDFGDDDLELDDDSGDDFAGELDDMMGDDELGGDAGGGTDSDSELDSFFEDLSSIEDMDDSGGGGESEAEEADFSQPEEIEEAKPAPVKKEKAPKEKGKGGKLKFIILILILLLGGGGGAAYWFFLRAPELMPPTPVVGEQPPPKVIMPAELPIKLEKQPVLRMEPEPEIPPPAKPAPARRSYLIQVAKCSYDACKEEYIEALRRDGEPVYQKSDGEKYDFIELVSRQVFSHERAQSLINKINRQNKMAGNASMKNQSNGYRITMGTFPALDRAKETKFYIEKMFPQKEVAFNLEHVRKNYSATKVFAGPYESRTEAKNVLQQLRKKQIYKDAFLVQTPEHI